jgi:NitT/TauT family transport system permease protein
MDDQIAPSAATVGTERLSHRDQVKERLLAVALVLLWLIFWEVSVPIGLLDARFFRTPSEIAATLVNMLVFENLVVHISLSVQRLVIGYLLGVVPALLAGWLIGRRRWLNAGCSPLLVILGAFPALALYPLIMLIFGLGEASKWVVVALSVFFPVLYFTRTDAALAVDGSQGTVDREALRGLARRPGLASLFMGLKLAGVIALLALIPAEFIGAKTGIGYVIWYSWQTFHPDPMYVGFALAGLLGLLTWLVLTGLERLILRLVTARGTPPPTVFNGGLGS